MGWCGVGDGRELVLSEKMWWYNRWRPYFLRFGLYLMMNDRWLWTVGESSFSLALAYQVITSEVSISLTLVNFPVLEV